jgi:hypothetical protein
MKSFGLGVCALVVAIAIAGCSTVTIRPEGRTKLVSSPAFEERESFFLWGLSPESIQVNVDHACQGRRVTQMQTEDTLLDNLMTMATLGLYRPRTVKIWCE